MQGVKKGIGQPHLYAGPQEQRSLSFSKWLILASNQMSVSQLVR